MMAFRKQTLGVVGIALVCGMVGCGFEDLEPLDSEGVVDLNNLNNILNNVTTPTNNGTTPTNNGTTPTNNGTSTNNGTTPTNNGTTPTNNGTTPITGEVCPGTHVPIPDDLDCNPVDPDLICPSGTTCGVIFTGQALDARCLNRSAAGGTQGEACGDCAPGYVCHLNVCKHYCELLTGRGCQVGESCASAGGTENMGIGLCADSCNL